MQALASEHVSACRRIMSLRQSVVLSPCRFLKQQSLGFSIEARLRRASQLADAGPPGRRRVQT